MELEPIDSAVSSEDTTSISCKDASPLIHPLITGMIPSRVSIPLSGGIIMAGTYFTVRGLAEATGVSVPAVRKALQTGRIDKAHCLTAVENKAILIPSDDPQAATWLQDSGTPTAEDMAAIRRENELLGKRTRQAERKAERAEKARVKTLEQMATMTQQITGAQHAIASIMMRQIEGGDGTVNAEVVE